ncbi:MAG: hypothetical protein AB1696_16375 [Planctomycetota bacterium]
MGELFERFAPRGVGFLHLMCGETDAIIRDYQKHYRTKIPAAGDPRLAIASQYRATSWPTAVIVDGAGMIRYHGQPLAEEQAKMEKALVEVSSGGGTPGYENGGLLYPRKETSAHPAGWPPEPAIAIASDGNPCVVFARRAGKNHEVVLRRFKEDRTDSDVIVASDRSDMLDPSIAVEDNGRIWMAWVSNAGGKYDIYASSVLGDRRDKAERITFSPDDAFHPRLAVDREGVLWLTYYEWRDMNGVSRDREVFVRHRGKTGWAPARQVSPTDVPAYEDHTDPAVAPHAESGVWVFWSWDHHPEAQPGRYRAKYPSIFVRQATKSALGPIQTVGSQQESFDLAPMAVTDNAKGVWCVWDRYLYSSGRKRVAAVSALEGDSFAEPFILPCEPSLCDSPRIAVGTEGPQLVWSALEDGKRQVFHSAFSRNQWTPPTRVKLPQEARYPAIAIDKRGSAWIAYTIRTDAGWDVCLKNL